MKDGSVFGWRRGVPAAAALLALCAVGCGAPSQPSVSSSFGGSSGSSVDSSAPAAKTPLSKMHHRLVIVMLDETSSFTPYWQACVDFAGKVASRLQAGDAFAVIGIDDHGNDPDDARIPIEKLDNSSLRMLGQRKVLAKRVRALQIRPHKKDLTDILEGIHQAAIFAESSAVEGYYPVLLIFSDMQETMHRPQRLPVPSDIAGWKFEHGGEAHCFYVNVTDWIDASKKQKGTSWDTMVGSWVAVLNAAGLDADAKKSFLQSGDTKLEIDRLFPAGAGF